MGARLVIRSIDGRRIEEEVGYPFDQDRVVIGRGRSADIRIPHRTVSELHATLRREPQRYTLTDEGSTNGTRVNGSALVPQRPRRLEDGDRIELGVYSMTFHTGALVTEPLSAERTAELARQLLREGRAPEDVLGAPRLVVVWGDSSGKHLALDRKPARWLVGTDASACQLVLQDDELADQHLEVVRDLDGVLLRCLPDCEPMQLGQGTRMAHRPRDGDELRIGNTALLYEEPVEQPLIISTEGEDEALPPDYRAHVPEPDPEPEPAAAGAAPTHDDAPDPTAVALREEPAARRTGSKPATTPRGLGADMVIYLLAAAILAISIGSLVVLMGAD